MEKNQPVLHLFGIKYADDLVGLSVEDVVRKSGIPTSYHVEVNKGGGWRSTSK